MIHNACLQDISFLRTGLNVTLTKVFSLSNLKIEELLSQDWKM